MSSQTNERVGLERIGVIGGSGFEHFLEDPQPITLQTPYGPPSNPLWSGAVGGRQVIFLKRHGEGHRLSPAAINYRANIWALKELGVIRVLATAASGSLDPRIHPGDLVICDQFIDRTRGREDTYFGPGAPVAHVAAADPYCPELRRLALDCARQASWEAHDGGTVVVIQGPRFSTRAESAWFAGMGWQVINMTQYPEVILARELELCYVGLALVTDYDAGVAGRPEIEPVTAAQAVRIFRDNNQRLQEVIMGMIATAPRRGACSCGSAMDSARV
ncbi:MAG TPA: S-methyl-5'-thioadenosine phosphorylase [Candidatus Dormibacteraeota bacterium]|jgi:5'-methylthioadenosine phosphorylase|nr:S-methyl-5'-thioadenosine phosphorylase [Candidatus Dormibacteraeota bacterium]